MSHYTILEKLPRYISEYKQILIHQERKTMVQLIHIRKLFENDAPLIYF